MIFPKKELIQNSNANASKIVLLKKNNEALNILTVNTRKFNNKMTKIKMSNN